MVAAGHRGHDHRLAGRHLRGVLGDPPGRAARLPAAADDPPHLGARGRPGLRPGDQLGALVGVVALVVGFGSSRTSPPPTAWRSPGPWPSTRSSSSSSSAPSGTSRSGWSRSGRPPSSPSTWRSSRPTSASRSTAAGSRSAIAAASFTVLTTWQKGREIVTANRTAEEGPLRDYVEELRAHGPAVYRPRGTAVFLNARADTTPAGPTGQRRAQPRPPRHRGHHLDAGPARPPRGDPCDGSSSTTSGYRDDGITHLTARFGFQDEPEHPGHPAPGGRPGDRVRAATPRRPPTSSRTSPSSGPTRPGMSAWRKRLFVAISRNPRPTRSSTSGCRARAIVIMGAQIEL